MKSGKHVVEDQLRKEEELKKIKETHKNNKTLEYVQLKYKQVRFIT